MSTAREKERAYRNPAHRAAFRRGRNTAKDGKPRSCPYTVLNQTSAYFRRAWLAGYDSVEKKA